MDKECVVHLHNVNGILLSYKKQDHEICRQMMELEKITLSEVTQTKKDRHDMYSLVKWILAIR